MAEMDVEPAAAANGSCPPDDKLAETVQEDKGEEMEDIEERKDDEEENLSGKEEMQTEDVAMVEGEDAKDEDFAGEEEDLEEDGEKPSEENDVKEEKDSGDGEKKVDQSEEAAASKKKRSRGRKVREKGDDEEKESGVKSKGSPRTPAAPIDRPVRERRTVERLVEIIEKEQNEKELSKKELNKEFLIEKGPGTPLKNIPNVAYKLSKKKNADLKLLHQTLFPGRGNFRGRGKAVNFKNHILQFSGFIWHGDAEMQKGKLKEKLDKSVKDTLMEFCDLFDIPFTKTNTRKEDLVVKLLEFMVAPHATTDVILAEKDQQSSKSRKRKEVSKGTTSRSRRGTSEKRPRKRQAKGEETPNAKSKRDEEMEGEDVEEDEKDSETGLPEEEEPSTHSDDDEKVIESEAADEVDDDDEPTNKGKQDTKRSSRQRGSASKEKKMGTGPKKALVTSAKSSSKSPSSKNQAEEGNDEGAKVFSRKKRTDVPKKITKATGKRSSTGKGKTEGKQSGPSKEDLRKTICEILKEVDFNTATFTDILKKLAAHYKMDLTPRKSAIKLMIQEELTKLADEDEENEDEDDEEDAGKGENSKSTGKELEA